MSEKDIYAIFDEMFEQLENDDPDLLNTSASQFSKIVNDKLESFAKQDVNMKYRQILDEITYTDKKDYLIKALSLNKSEVVKKYLDMINNDKDLEEVYTLVNNDYQFSKDDDLKYILDAYEVYKQKTMELLNKQMMDSIG
ncbi:MAG: hypothetical protein PUF67_01455 [Firmicutes bacterium]|nr:hypothetical protein [Bacillota bacterium]